MDICLMTRTARGKTKNYKIYYIIFTSYRVETTGQVTDFILLIYLVSGSADGQGGRVFQLFPPVQLPQAHVRRHGGAGTRVRPIRQVSVNDNYYRKLLLSLTKTHDLGRILTVRPRCIKL